MLRHAVKATGTGFSPDAVFLNQLERGYYSITLGSIAACHVFTVMRSITCALRLLSRVSVLS